PEPRDQHARTRAADQISERRIAARHHQVRGLLDVAEQRAEHLVSGRLDALLPCAGEAVYRADGHALVDQQDLPLRDALGIERRAAMERVRVVVEDRDLLARDALPDPT